MRRLFNLFGSLFAGGGTNTLGLPAPAEPETCRTCSFYDPYSDQEAIIAAPSPAKGGGICKAPKLEPGYRRVFPTTWCEKYKRKADKK